MFFLFFICVPLASFFLLAALFGVAGARRWVVWPLWLIVIVILAVAVLIPWGVTRCAYRIMTPLVKIAQDWESDIRAGKTSQQTEAWRMLQEQQKSGKLSPDVAAVYVKTILTAENQLRESVKQLSLNPELDQEEIPGYNSVGRLRCNWEIVAAIDDSDVVMLPVVVNVFQLWGFALAIGAGTLPLIWLVARLLYA